MAATGAGCFLGGSKRAAKPLSEAQLAQLVVLPADLETAFAGTSLVQFDAGRLTANDAIAGPRADPGRFDRRAGWQARYRRADASATGGVLVVESRVDEFGDAEGAKSDLTSYAQQLEAAASEHGGRPHPDVPRVGSATVATSYQQKALGGSVDYYTVAWRHGRLTASVTVSGFDGTSLDDAVALARQVQRRLEGAG